MYLQRPSLSLPRFLIFAPQPLMKLPTLHRVPGTRMDVRGFTLAEVMIALGIVATVMVGLLGMIPLAVRSVRESANLAISARIAEEIISNIQMADWKDIDQDWKGQVLKFDNEGLPFVGSKGQFVSYEAKVDLPSERVEAGDVKYRAVYLRKVNVSVEYTPNGQMVANRREQNTKRSTFYVANQSRVSREQIDAK
jgi:uncharacterized protein (TIGR02598 family)